MDKEQLIKVLNLEESKGYKDSAVTSGLDKFLSRYLKEHPDSFRPPFPSYKELDITEREEWIGTMLKRIIPVKKQVPAETELSLDDSITRIKGIGPKLVPKFAKLGVSTVRDFLYFFPRKHIDYSSPTYIASLQMGIEQTVLVQVWQASVKKTRGRMRILEVVVGDNTGTMKVNFFNQPYLLQKLTANTKLMLSGRVNVWRGNRSFQPTSYEIIEADTDTESNQLVPVYPLTEGMYPRQTRKMTRQVLDTVLSDVEDFLPEKIRKGAKLLELNRAIEQAHYPVEIAAKYAARRRLAFDELLLIQIGVLSRKRERQEGVKGIKMSKDVKCVERFLKSLPFELTAAQKRALGETCRDLKQPVPMSRLLHGDVGSGKTVVATGAMLLAAANSCQAALMVPTEILAEQHFKNISRLLGSQNSEGIVRTIDSVLKRPVTMGLLTGSIKQKGKKELYERIASGEVDIIIGTQALIQKKVEFKKLGLVIVDEQHRFGVVQRLELHQKGAGPHMLAMSATPIPRTLSLTLYGDLDISLIDELPPGRQEIKTKWLEPQKRQSGYSFVRKQVSEGRQAYVICPLVEESESIDARAATTEYERLSRKIFPDLRLGLLHGRMSGAEKDEVMQRFNAGEIDVLVSTSVVEVGVDVPNATVMLVEGADRFGLSQLHQFRGRVWRSSYQGYCILLSENPTEEGRERLLAMESTHNGFVLAEKDLEMRGPGEFFGTRQSGLPDLKMARLTDVNLLELARKAAIRIFEDDPLLENPEHQALSHEVARLWKGKDEIE